ncbi:hypothetical protein HMPREF1981_01245 [Bacteroides pyogenes F0041]|uniref:Uncharacterized protein n=1 Tax=Bacteroides pyogenes F0041 TaxID=1321819 RepID=U2CMW8_9BACE|nr:hypothetical protein HMPREF1981_01245 [Bacteroides pyogenes F0041]
MQLPVTCRSKRRQIHYQGVMPLQWIKRLPEKPASQFLICSLSIFKERSF